MKPFSENDLAVLYDFAFDYDGSLISMALEVGNKLGNLTEALVFLSLVKDNKLKQIAMVHFLRENDLMEMLLESRNQISYNLSFEINGDVTLRTFLGDESFKELVFTAVEVIGDKDRETCVCLLAKISESERVL